MINMSGASRPSATGNPLAKTPAIERTYDADRKAMLAAPGSTGFESEVDAMCALLAAVSLRVIRERVANRARLRIVK